MVICSTPFTFYGPYIIDDGHLSPVLRAEIIATFAGKDEVKEGLPSLPFTADLFF